MIMDKQPIYNLVAKIQVMKPNHIKDDNLKQVVKLNEVLNSPEYAGEEKIDGVHYLHVGGLFFSKEHIERTDNYPHLRDFFIKLGMPNLILDGEMNYPGKTSQYCTHVTGADPGAAVQFQEEHGYMHYTIFDMIRTPKGSWLIKEPYKTRRKMLEYFYNTFVVRTPMEEYIHITDMTIDNKEQFKDAILYRGGEGVVLKRLDSYYIMPKNPGSKAPMWMWMKIKQKDEADLIITGFLPPNKEYEGTDFDNWPYWKEENGVMMPVSKPFHFGWIGSVEFSAFIDGVLTKICTGSGMNEEDRKDMTEHSENYLGKVARVGYMERTEAGYPRHPKYVELHPDKTPEECTWELE